MGQTRNGTDGRIYICIDLKTFYASVECADRGLDTLKDNLIVADLERGRGTICLAITAAMKKLGIRNRCRVFEIPRGVDYIVAPPRMRHYMEVSAQIYGTYLEYVSAEDVWVYSIDECFIDATPYLALYGCSAQKFARTLMQAVYDRFGILATAGIGTNLFLAKVALDVTAKHAEDGIGYLNEETFRQNIWDHRPITDIWSIGPGIARRLATMGAQDLGGVARLSEEALYREFGVNAEYLIDHAWGREPCTIAEIRAYRPSGSSATSGQVLSRPYSHQEARTVLREMVDALALDLVHRGDVCDRLSLYVGYAKPSGWQRPPESALFEGGHGVRCVVGGYGFGGANAARKLGMQTNSFKLLAKRFDALYCEICDPGREVKRINIGVGGLIPEEFSEPTLFYDEEFDANERDLQRTVLDIKGRFGKNSVMRGTSYKAEATGLERNNQVGGHRA